jgi:hypothetical protein
MEQKQRFVSLAGSGHFTMTELCRTSDVVERLICTEKRLRSTWGPKKIQQILMTQHGLESPPAVSTVGEVLKRHDLVAERRRRGAVFKVERSMLTAPERPNHVLGVDFKGEPKQGALFRISSGINLQQGVLRRKDNAVPLDAPRREHA